MRYRKSPWYIAGLIITGIAVAVMLVTMVMMYYGNDAAIIWFFGACPVLLIGYFMVQTTIRRYEEADATDGEPLPMFWRIRFAYHNLKVRVITKNLWRKIIALVIALFSIATVVLSGLCGYWAFAKSAVAKDPEYKSASSSYNKYYTEWETARENGDDAKRQEIFAEMEEEHLIMRKYEVKMEGYDKNISSALPWIIFSGASAIFFGTVFYAYVRHQNSKQNNPETEQKESENENTTALD